jgi:hypothetical protein
MKINSPTYYKRPNLIFLMLFFHVYTYLKKACTFGSVEVDNSLKVPSA